jgi:hypothetical protein
MTAALNPFEDPQLEARTKHGSRDLVSEQTASKNGCCNN